MKKLLSNFYLFYFAIIGVYIIFIPKVLAMISYSPKEIGIIFSAAPLVRFVLPFIFARGFVLSAKIFNLALVILMISAIWFYLSLHNFYQLFFSNIFFGIGLGLILPYIEFISLSLFGKEEYGKIRLFGSIGFIIVALVLVKFLSSADIALYYLLGLTSITVIISFIIVSKFAEDEKKQESSTNDEDATIILKDWQLWLGLTLVQVSFGAFYNFFTIYETNYGISLDTTIYLWSFGVVVEVFMLYFQGNLLKKNLLLILQITTFAGALRWFLIFLFPQNLVVLFFAQSLHALSFALFHSSAISYLFHRYKNKTLIQQFFSGITYGFGALVGALISGYIYQYYPEYLFLIASILAFFAFVSLYQFSNKIS